MKKRILFCLCLLWMGIIFYFSNQPGMLSERLSLGIVNSFIGIETSPFTDFIHVGLRKSAHIASYFILTLLIYSLLSNFKLKYTYFYSFLIPFIYACSDEFHQTFVANRLGSLSDVGIDSIGISLALLFIYLLKKRLTPQNNSKSSL